MINPLKFFFSSFLLLIIFCSNPSFPQEPGKPFNPETANGANYIHSTGHRLLWQNPDSTIYNIIYFSEDTNLVAQLDSSVILYDGTPSTVYNTIFLTSVEPLDWSKKYYWRVVEYYASDSIVGPLWHFSTMLTPHCEEELLFDDFEIGLTNWIVTNDGGICVWDVIYPPYPNPYLLPSSSLGGVLAADAVECGAGTSTLTTITYNLPLGSYYQKILEFDNDWNALDSADAAYVEVSTDGGFTWEIIWSKVGIDCRETHENIFIPYNTDILLRFRSVQPGWNSWWAIDNAHLTHSCPLAQFYPPYNLILDAIIEPTLKIQLSWSVAGTIDPVYIYRKDGLPTDTTTYTFIDQVDFNVTNYVDTTVEKNKIYTYGIFMIGGGKSNEATAYVPDIITSVQSKNEMPTEFSLEQNYPNPFNPTTTIKYQISELSFVALKVFDILGREVATLVNDEKQTGSYEIEFEGDNLTSGIYFYQLRAGNFVESKKMVLTK